MNELIRESLKKAAEEGKMSPEEKTDLLISTLTRYLTSKLEEENDENDDQ